VTISIVGIALSVVAFVNGSKMAIPVFIGCCATLGVTLAVIKYSTLIAIASLVIAGGVFVYTVLMKNKALKELVTGGEKVKCLIEEQSAPLQDLMNRADFNAVHQNTQSKYTQALVKKIKNGGS
jgi:hypothetical protein